MTVIARMGRCLAIAALGGWWAADCAAHGFWVSLSAYHLDGTEEEAGTHAYIGWGHRFPADGKLKPEALAYFRLIRPDGSVADLAPDPGGYLVSEVVPAAPGAYRVMAAHKDQFFTVWRENGVEKWDTVPKTGISGVTMSGYNEMRATALLVSGDPSAEGIAWRPMGEGFEVIPLSNPMTLGVAPGRQHPRLGFIVLRDGKPVSGAELNATYLGFSTRGEYAQTTTSDAQGKAEVLITQPGVWMVAAHKTFPIRPEYADKADGEYYDTALTFQVK